MDNQMWRSHRATLGILPISLYTELHDILLLSQIIQEKTTFSGENPYNSQVTLAHGVARPTTSISPKIAWEKQMKTSGSALLNLSTTCKSTFRSLIAPTWSDNWLFSTGTTFLLCTRKLTPASGAFYAPAARVNYTTDSSLFNCVSSLFHLFVRGHRPIEP